MNIAVDLRVEITTIIQQARETELPEEVLQRFEGLLGRVREELEQPPGQGKFQRVKELMDFAANVKEQAPLAARLIADHGDKIQQMVDAAT